MPSRLEHMFAPALLDEGSVVLPDEPRADEWAWLFDPLGDAWFDPADTGAEPDVEISPEVEALLRSAPWRSESHRAGAECATEIAPAGLVGPSLSLWDPAGAEPGIAGGDVDEHSPRGALGDVLERGRIHEELPVVLVRGEIEGDLVGLVGGKSLAAGKSRHREKRRQNPAKCCHVAPPGHGKNSICNI